MSESASGVGPPAAGAAISHRHRLRVFGLAMIAAAVCSPALARSPYDGAWSVLIVTRSGTCQPSSRFGVEIVNGRVLGPGGGASVHGQVSRGGAVSVSVQSQGQSANGYGRLGGSSGSGRWRGRGSAGLCAGTWMAQRG